MTAAAFRKILLAVFTAGSVGLIPGIAPAMQPATNPMRTAAQIGDDLIQLGAQIQSAGGSAAGLSDAMKRSDSALKLIPLVKRQDALLNEYAAASPASLPPAALDQMRQHNRALLYLLGDQETRDQINTAASGNDMDAAVEAFSTRVLAQWIAAGKDLDAQTRLVDEIEKLDQTYPKNAQLTLFTFSLSQNAASDDLADRLMSISTDKMDNKIATALKTRVPLIKQTRTAEENKKKGKPSP